MSFDNKPFYSSRTEEEREESEKKYGKVQTIRISQREQEWLDQLKTIFDIKSNSTVLKVAAFNYLIVLRNQFQPKYMAWLLAKDRSRLSDYENIDKWISEKL